MSADTNGHDDELLYFPLKISGMPRYLMRLEDVPPGLREFARQARELGPPQPREAPLIEMASGGFRYGGKVHTLTGRPLALLAALLGARDRRATVAELRVAMNLNDYCLTYPEQAVKDTAKRLRAALKQAGADGLLSSSGRGEGLTYRLNMPC